MLASMVVSCLGASSFDGSLRVSSFYTYKTTTPMRKHRFVSLLLTISFIFCGFYLQANYAPSYINQHKDLAIQEMYRSGIPASITLAQAIHESAWGRGTLAMNSNNYFGIKCKDYWTGPTYYIEDDDKVDGELVKSCFRVYESVENSFVDHSNFLRDNPRYRKLFTYRLTDYRSWAKGLQECGYATDPKYAEKLIRTIERYQLYVYDTASPNVQPQPQAIAPVVVAPSFNISTYLPQQQQQQSVEQPWTKEENLDVPDAYVLPEGYQRGDFQEQVQAEVQVSNSKFQTPNSKPQTKVQAQVSSSTNFSESISPSSQLPNEVQAQVSSSTYYSEPSHKPQIPNSKIQHPNIQSSTHSESIIKMTYAGTSSSTQLGRRPRVSNSQRR